MKIFSTQTKQDLSTSLKKLEYIDLIIALIPPILIILIFILFGILQIEGFIILIPLNLAVIGSPFFLLNFIFWIFSHKRVRNEESQGLILSLIPKIISFVFSLSALIGLIVTTGLPKEKIFLIIFLIPINIILLTLIIWIDSLRKI